MQGPAARDLAGEAHEALYVQRTCGFRPCIAARFNLRGGYFPDPRRNDMQ